MASNQPDPNAALRDAVNRLGSQAALARLCGVSQAAVWKWLKMGKALPAQHVLTIERATGISRHRLRPDIYPLPEVPAGRTVGTGAPVVACDRGAEMQRAARA